VDDATCGCADGERIVGDGLRGRPGFELAHG
jgi:hypothetical protein